MKLVRIAVIVLLVFMGQSCSQPDSSEDVQELSRQLQKDREDLIEVAKAMPFNCSGSLNEAKTELERINKLIDSSSVQVSEAKLATIPALENYIEAIESGRAKGKALRNRIETIEEKLLSLTGTIPKWEVVPTHVPEELDDPFK